MNPERSDGRRACTEFIEVTLMEALFDFIRFALHYYQDVSALNAGHFAQSASNR